MRFIDTRHDRWHRVEGEDGPIPHPDPQPDRLLTLEQWHAVRDTWPRGLPTGVLLPNTLDVDTLAEDLRGPDARLSLVVLQFPKWTDGRAYSQARRAARAPPLRRRGACRRRGAGRHAAAAAAHRLRCRAAAPRPERRGGGACAGLLSRPLPGRRASSRNRPSHATWPQKPLRSATAASSSPDRASEHGRHPALCPRRRAVRRARRPCGGGAAIGRGRPCRRHRAGHQPGRRGHGAHRPDRTPPAADRRGHAGHRQAARADAGR